MQDNYEIIGNQIKFYFKGDTAHKWNNIPNPEFRSLPEIEKWCAHTESTVSHINCIIDGLNQNAMSQSEVTDFLYRFASSYVKTAGDGITSEGARIEASNFISHATYQISQDASDIAYQVIQMALDCIMYLGGIVWSLLM